MKKKLVVTLGIFLGVASASINAQDDARTASYLKQIEAVEKTDSKRIFGLEQFGDSTMSAKEKEALTKDWIMTDTHVLITAITKGDVNKLNDELKALEIKEAKIHKRSITGKFPIKNIPQLDKCSATSVLPEIIKTSMGLVDNESIDASFGRNITELFGLDGTGVKVGIISSGFFSQPDSRSSVLSGDIPGEGNPNGYTQEVQVLAEGSVFGDDEGRGMGELIHDIAPGAELFFYTGSQGIYEMADGIAALTAAGCDIIVDDVVHVSSPYFQDGLISDAINAARDKGVTYFTAAGNFSNSSYQAPYKPSGVFDENGGEYHDFGGGDITQRVSFNGDANIISFQWDDRFYDFVNEDAFGDVETNMDVFVFDAETGGLVISVTNENVFLPIENFSITSRLLRESGNLFDIMIKKVSGPDPRFIKYIDFSRNINFVEDFEGNNAGTAFGRANAEGAITVGAMSFQQSPAFGGSFKLQSLSTYGGVPILRDRKGEPIEPVFRQKPEVIGTNGTNTTFFGGRDIDSDGFPNFFGTSAAAPNVAGIAALMLQANKDLTPQDVKRIMIASTVDMDNPVTEGFDTGYDVASGNGYVLADKAIIMAAPKSLLPETPTIYRYQAVSSDTNRIVGAITDGEDLSLNTTEGGVINIEAVVVGGTEETSVAMELEGNTAFTVPNQKLRQFVREYSQRSRREVRNRRGNGKDISKLYTTPERSVIDGFTNFKGAIKRTAIENVAPYSLFGDRNGNFNQWSPGVGAYMLKATPYSGKNAVGIAGATDTINFNINYTPLILLNTKNVDNAFVEELFEDIEIDIETVQDQGNLLSTIVSEDLTQLNASASQVDFDLSGTQTFFNTTTTAPFSVFDDDGSNFWNPEVGPYTLRYQVLAREGDYSASSAPFFINFSVVDPNATAAKTAIVGNGDVGFAVYPNPTTGILSLEAKNGELSDVQVFNALGQRVFGYESGVDVPKQLDLSSYDNGLYIVKAFIGNQSFATKIIIEK